MQVTRLCLSEMDKATDSFFAELADAMERIEHLTLHALPVTTVGLNSLVTRSFALRHLRILHCHRIPLLGRDSLAALLTRAPLDMGHSESQGRLTLLARKHQLSLVSVTVRPSNDAQKCTSFLASISPLGLDQVARPRVEVHEEEEPMRSLLASLDIAQVPA